jgi:hypothetical protein
MRSRLDNGTPVGRIEKKKIISKYILLRSQKKKLITSNVLIWIWKNTQLNARFRVLILGKSITHGRLRYKLHDYSIVFSTVL